MYQLGEVLSIPFTFYRHYMVVVGDGFVVHASKEAKAVVMERLSDVCEGKQITSHGRWSHLSNAEIVRRAKNELGKPYRLINWNCEHVARRISGLDEKSPQIAFGVAALAVVGIFLLARSKAA